MRLMICILDGIIEIFPFPLHMIGMPPSEHHKRVCIILCVNDFSKIKLYVHKLICDIHIRTYIYILMFLSVVRCQVLRGQKAQSLVRLTWMHADLRGRSYHGYEFGQELISIITSQPLIEGIKF